MTIEEKAKAYDIALDKIKMLLDTGSSCSREELEYVFPELAESEDEKIRNGFLYNLRELREYKGINPPIKTPEHYSAWIAWLENQGEQKPAEWSEKDEEISEAIIKRIKGESEALSVSLSSAISWVGNIKDRVQHQSQWKPSDEQLYILESVIADYDNQGLSFTKEMLYDLYEDLKKLKG
jgi:hypothetical protein